jgi:glycosyltransferase involved in cell wall biosynthesis
MLRGYVVAHSVRHLSGPRRLQLARDEAVVTCVVKNGEFYIENFIEHYSQMGFRHIFFLDNGSSDQTIAIAQRHANVSVCTSNLPIEAHQGLFKAYMARTCGEGGWCLDADIDEFFDYPFSSQINLREFLKYLNEQRSNAVITQLLDMFSNQPPSRLPSTQQQHLKEMYAYYDLADINRVEYRTASLVESYGDANEITHDGAALFFGGVRKRLYGNNCLLTKHSLFRPDEVELFPHVHFMNHARLAEVSCVMRHYKLTSTALATAVQNQEGFVGNGSGYRDFIQFLTTHPDCQIVTDSAVRFQSVEDLLGSGFIFCSDEYREYAHRRQAAMATMD